MRPSRLQTLVFILFAFASLASLAAQVADRDFEGNKRAVLYLGEAPAIDGDFADWDGLQGSSTRVLVFSGKHPEGEGVGFFILRSDNKNLYIYANVYDITPHEVDLPAPIAWRDDSVEVYIGTQTATHEKYAKDDNHLRIVPVSKDDPFAFDLSVNDVGAAERCAAAVVYRDDGYTIEAQVPLDILLIKKFTVNQMIRVEFQVNNAARIERDRLMHWKSPKDDPYFDPSGWGDCVVLPLPATR